MPKIGECLSLNIYMYYNDHPPPHFHVRGTEKAIVGFDGVVFEGSLPSKTEKYVCEWALRHRSELESNWIKARAQLPLKNIID